MEHRPSQRDAPAILIALGPRAFIRRRERCLLRRQHAFHAREDVDYNVYRSLMTSNGTKVSPVDVLNNSEAYNSNQ